MFHKYKWQLLLSSLGILLPIPVGILLADRFTLQLPMNLGLQFGLPAVGLLIGQWLCFAITAKDPGNQNRNRKVMATVLWIMPLMSNLMCGILFALLMGVEFSPMSWMAAGMGLMFVILGNYMPKTRMNSTIGIKVVWAYSSEENWNATHRFAGRVWVIGGIGLMFGAVLPEAIGIALLFTVMLVICILPIWYSWRFFKKEQGQGRDVKATYSKVDKKILQISGVFIILLTIFICSVMFVGDLEYTFGDTVMTIQADWYADATIRYETITNMEYREETVPGTRVGGFASSRLLMGFFQNEEFGTYTRYTYNNPEGCIVLTIRNQTWVISGSSGEETAAIYETLLSKIP